MKIAADSISAQNADKLVFLLRQPPRTEPNDAAWVTQLLKEHPAAQSSDSDLMHWEKFLVAYITFCSTEDKFTALIDCALGMNYAFDAAWQLPVVKLIYGHLVSQAFQATSQGAALNKTQKIKSACVALDALRAKMQDRLPLPNSRKAGTLFLLNYVFKCYLSLQNLAQLHKVLDYVFTHVLPDTSMVLQYFSKSDQVTHYYYLGKFYLIQHNIPEASLNLKKAFKFCHVDAVKNRRLIVIHLVAAQIVRGRFPQRRNGNIPLLRQYNIYQYFAPLIYAISSGNMHGFVQALDGPNQPFFIKFHLYNILRVRCEYLVHRNLLKKVFIIGSSITTCGTFGYNAANTSDDIGMDVDATASASAATTTQTPRIDFVDIATALLAVKDPSYLDALEDTENAESTSGPKYHSETIICLLSQMVDAGLVKGYVSLSKQCLVVSRKMPFPELTEAMDRLISRERWWVARVARRNNVGDDEDDD